MRMHAQTHISGHVSGQMPIQAGSFSDLSHPNGNSVPSQMQHPGGLHMGSDEQTRQIVRDDIFRLIARGKATNPMMIPKLPDMARRLDEALYRNASSKEEYANLNTLEQRLQMWIACNARGQQLPTPGMTNHRSSNSSVTSSAGNSMIPVSMSECNTGVIDTMNSRRLLSTSNGSTAGVSFSSSDDKSTYAGSIPNGRQHSPANISMSPGGNGPVPSIGLQRTASQMMPMPGLNNTNVNSEPFNSTGTLHQQMIHMTGDGYGSNTSELSGPEKLRGTRIPAGSTIKGQNMNQLWKMQMLDLLVHASCCSCSANCSYLNCGKVKGLFRHGSTCKIRASRGCGLCKKLWYILQLHARACKLPECRVPRCENLKEHSRRSQQQAESRRRAAVNEMMRQLSLQETVDD